MSEGGETGEVEIFFLGMRLRVESIAYGIVERPAPPEKVLVSGRYDFECKFVYRPQVVIRDALSDRVDDIVARYSEEATEEKGGDE